MTVQAELLLLDTNVVVAALRKSAVWQHVDGIFQLRHRDVAPLVSVITAGELQALAERNNWGQARRDALAALLRDLTRVDIRSDDVLRCYAELDAWTRARGRPIGENDTWIAATAKATGARLVTTDTDFDVLHPEHITRTWIDPRLPAAPPAPSATLDGP